MALQPAEQTQPPTAPLQRTLVIGYGNQLRGDDAVGLLVAEEVASWALPNVTVRGQQQLTPELVPELAAAQAAIFVDARLAQPDDATVCVCEIKPSWTDWSLAHVADPRDLLALAAALYGHYPRAWWITLPAHQFVPGAELSAETCRARAVALERVGRLLRQELATA